MGAATGSATGPGRPRVLVAGAGMAGLAAALEALEEGAAVTLLSRTAATRSPSTAFRGALNAPEGDVASHIADALAFGGPGADEATLQRRAKAALSLAAWLAQAGVPFDRSGVAYLRHRLPGASEARALSAGPGFGRMVVHALDARLRHFEAAGRLTRAEGWHLADLLKGPEGRCEGVAAVHARSLEARAFGADAVVLATGGAGRLARPSACALEATGAPLGLALLAGAPAVDPDRLAWTAAVPGPDKDLPVPILLLAAGASATATELDLRGLPRPALKRWGGVFPRLAGAFTGRNPLGEPLPLRQAVSGTLGGLAVDEGMATGLPGLWAAGEAAWGGFGAAALPGDEALAWLHQGREAGRHAARALPSGAADPARLEAAAAALRHQLEDLRGSTHAEPVHTAWKVLLESLRAAAAQGADLAGLDARLASLAEARVRPVDHAHHANAELLLALEFPRTVAWARAVLAALRLRPSHAGAVGVGVRDGAFLAEARS
jgi:succinate dehydrogenase / fumarate reductase flavoprotein subunit